MKLYSNIISFLFFVIMSSTCFSQNTSYCPEQMLLIQKYKSKNYLNASQYIDTVLIQCPDKSSDAYFLHLCGFINFNIYREIDGKSSSSPARPAACDYFIKSVNYDNKNQFTEKNLQALNSFSISYINDALMIMQKMEFKKQSKALDYYNIFKKLKSIAEPNYDFSNISIDFFNGMGRMYKMRYENDKINSKNLLDSSINYFNKSLALNPNQYTPNYDLGILYHNLGVDIILEELDIDADLEMVILMQEQAVDYFSKSLPYLEKVYQMKPEETSIVQGIAAVYYSLNDMEKHVEYMNILKGLESKNSGDN